MSLVGYCEDAIDEYNTIIKHIKVCLCRRWYREYKNIFDCDFNDDRFKNEVFEDIHHLSLFGVQKAKKIIKEQVGI